MIALIIMIIFLLAIGMAWASIKLLISLPYVPTSDTSCRNTSVRKKPAQSRQRKVYRPSRRELRQIRKARERAEMEAFEDWYMYYEVFNEDCDL